MALTDQVLQAISTTKNNTDSIKDLVHTVKIRIAIKALISPFKGSSLLKHTIVATIKNK
jgi:hypothetical protein